jgi:TRAP-type mannitol/chloroaromatic compound transport system permease large subunit
MLIVYGASAGFSAVQLYAGAFSPGIVVATPQVGYVVVARDKTCADAAIVGDWSDCQMISINDPTMTG